MVGGANINTVLSIVNILKDRYRVYALDLPGFGQSQEPIGSFEYEKIVKEFMHIQGIKKTHLVGHSFGGKISIILGSKYPELVNKIVLIDSAGLIPKRGSDYYKFRAVINSFFD